MPTKQQRADEDTSASVATLLRQQSANGAFVASADFAEYQYCWLRDASFVAYALDRAGEHDASARYHRWVQAAIGEEGIAPQIERAIAAHRSGKPLGPNELPPARFSLSGTAVSDDGWPNFQIDGYGTWLWSLGEHHALRPDGSERDLEPTLAVTVERVGRYLADFAFEPCYDVWEEHGDEVHSSTLASVYAGLDAAARLLGRGPFAERALEVRSHLERRGRADGRYAKSSARDGVDASALWLGVPFHAVPFDGEPFQETVKAIESDLLLDGGVRRYLEDTYFGGGAWPVLTSSLGWYYALAGRRDDAYRCLAWCATRLDAEGRLAEQFGGEVRDRVHYEQWVQRWGLPAADLLWSHAMHVILAAELSELGAGAAQHLDGDGSQKRVP